MGSAEGNAGKVESLLGDGVRLKEIDNHPIPIIRQSLSLHHLGTLHHLSTLKQTNLIYTQAIPLSFVFFQ